MQTKLILALLALWRTLYAAELQPGLISSEFIFDEQPTKSCHASTLAETKAGLVAAWFGGTREGAGDVGIWLSRQSEGKWTAPVEVANGIQSDGARHPCWNPVLFQPAGAALMLFYKVGPSPSKWWGMLRTSADDGKTWSEGRKLPEGIMGPIKNKPVQLPGGEILCPTSSESNPAPNPWRVHFEITSDMGTTWKKIAPPEGDGINAIQPSILFLKDAALMAVGRTRAQKIFETRSRDGGKTWTALKLIELPNPNSGTDAVTLKDGRHLLIYNHTIKGRTPLNLALSSDGEHWSGALVLENTPGEFSYPAIIQSGDGKVHVVFTYKRERIKHVLVDPEKLDAKPIVNGAWPAN